MALSPTSSKGASAASAPGYELDYAEATANVTISATSEATATTIVSGAAVTYDGSTVVLIECFVPVIEPNSGAAARAIVPVLYDGATSLGFLAQAINQVAANLQDVPLYAARRLTPSAAAHTYSLRAYATVANASAKCGAAGAGNYQPAFIRITRV